MKRKYLLIALLAVIVSTTLFAERWMVLHKKKTIPKQRNLAQYNTTVNNMRGGFDLVAGKGARVIRDCTAIGCQTQGFSEGTNISIYNNKGDAMYGPLLSFWYLSSINGYENLKLINTDSDTPPELIEFNGTNHTVILENYNNAAPRSRQTPIYYGESFWADARIFRNPLEDPLTHAGQQVSKLRTKRDNL